jgi:hypothetical protein
MVTSDEIERLDAPEQFMAYADAYLDAAARLCSVLARSTRRTNYARGCVVLYLAIHAIELFLKAAILCRKPNERFSHDLDHIHNRYRALYPRRALAIDIPFKTEYVGLEPPEIAKARKERQPQDQLYRYPRNKEGGQWRGIFGFEPNSFLVTIRQLQKDFERIRSEIFTANLSLSGSDSPRDASWRRSTER